MLKTLLISTSVIAGVSAAQAQTAPVESTPEGRTRTAQTANLSPIDDQGLQDIIVTATKVETVLQRTPQAISTISGDALVQAGIATAQDLNKLVPGLQVEQNGAASSIFIRGIGTRVLGPTNDPAVAFSVDGVYYSRAIGTTTTFFDLDRIEVVKGPQGTLYGRNATGGAVNLVSRRPILGERSMNAELEVGNYDSVRAVAGLTLPLGEKAALRLAGQTVYNSGFLSDGYNDTNFKAGRMSLLVEPTDAISIFVSGDYSSQGGQGPGVVILGPSVSATTPNSLRTRFVVPSDPYVGPSDPRSNAVLAAAIPAQGVAGPGAGPFCPARVTGAATPGGTPVALLCQFPFGVAPITTDGFQKNEFYGGNATVNIDAGFADITGVGGYRKTRVDSLQRIDYGRQRLIGDTDQYSAELRIASSAQATGPFKWLIGGFYLNEEQLADITIASNNQVIPAPGAVCATAPVNGICLARPTLIQDSTVIYDPKLINMTYAAFGQVTVSITDRLRLTGGVRYTHERKSEADGQVTAVYSVPVGLSRTYLSEGSVKFNDVSYRAGIEVDVAPRSMFYATFSTAFHAGGFNLGVQAGPNRYEYDPEHVRSYVVGIKNRFFDNRLQLNVEGFWNDYDDYQQSSLGRINDGSQTCSVQLIRATCALTLRTDNAAKARVRGVEGDILLRVGRNGTIGTNILYNDAKFREFNFVNGLSGAVTNYSGTTLPNVTKWTISGNIAQDFPLANGGAITFGANTIYRSGAFLWFERAQSQFQKAYTRTDLTLGYVSPDKIWRITGFVRNVEDKVTVTQGGPLNAATGLRFANINPPRTYGAILGMRF